ncbi:MAG: hypothetical protein E7774_02780 [Bradyrhizobium sp.]|nr:MAG: hypothetical protein E7774_02780 [Bradyrhizobium sp.]
MNPAKMHIPQNISELLDLTTSMLLSAPKFLDKTGYLPFLNLDYVFEQLHAGLAQNRQRLGEERYNRLFEMSGQIRALFEADPDDKTGQTLQGCKVIHQMNDILRSALRKS